MTVFPPCLYIEFQIFGRFEAEQCGACKAAVHDGQDYCPDCRVRSDEPPLYVASLYLAGSVLAGSFHQESLFYVSTIVFAATLVVITSTALRTIRPVSRP